MPSAFVQHRLQATQFTLMERLVLILDLFQHFLLAFSFYRCMDRMADDSSNKQNETIREEQLAQFSPSECIGWFAVLCSVGVATVTINALLIIVYLKEPSLRKRSMYLVISLGVADMCVGGISLSIDIFNSGVSCSFWKIAVLPSGIWPSILIAFLFVFTMASVINLAVISLQRMHATFRPLEHCLIRKWIFGASVAVVWFTAILSAAYVYSCTWIFVLH